MGLRGRLTLAMLAACLTAAGGCKMTQAEQEENARLKTIVAKVNEANRDLMLQLEQSEARTAQLRQQIAIKDRQIAALKDGVEKLQRMSVLGRKEQAQLKILAQELGGKLVGNRLELPGDFFFGSGRFELRDTARAAIKELATILKDKELVLLIVGHTDSDPVKNPRLKRAGVENNRQLSVRRALSVLEALEDAGYPERLMYPTGWGDLYRLDTSGSDKGKALNRRVDILIDPAASGLFTISAITDVAPAVAPTGGEQGPVNVEE